MADESSKIRWLGPFATPVGVAVSFLGLIVTFRSYAETVGWKTCSLVLFLVSLGWSVWFLFSRVTAEPGLVGFGSRRVFRHRERVWRLLAPLLPVSTGIICIVAFLQPRGTDYSALLQGGGPYSPIVVFDSEPRGAEVRVAKIWVADDDPWLENKSGKIEVFRLPARTLTRARFWQGQYWAVFELKSGRRMQKDFTVTGPTIVKVEF